MSDDQTADDVLDGLLDDDLMAELEDGDGDSDAGGSDDSTSLLFRIQTALYGLALLPVLSLTPILRALPPTWKLYHKLHLWSAWQMQRAANADALANVRHPNDREDVLPAAFVEGDEDELSGWKVKGLGEKRYDPGVRGGSSSRIGKADLIHINEDDLEQGTWTEATIDAAFQLDRERYLFADAEVGITENIVAVDPSLEGGEGAAVADGGSEVAYQSESVDVSLERPGVLEDTLVPLTSRAGYDGQLISWNSYSNLKAEKSDQQAVRDAKNAGWMAAKLDDIGARDMLKWALILGAAGAILLFHQDIGAAISSFGGGGGGGDVAPTAGLGLLPLLRYRLGGE
jgi:hypothetical protein